MNKLFIIGAVLLVSAPALAQSLGEKTGVNSALGVAPSTQDFVTQAAVSDLFEIESSRLAVQKATDDATKNFASAMVTDHTKTSNELKLLVSSGKVQAPVPAQMDATHRKMLDKLQSLDPRAFTNQYRSDQVDAHEDAVSLFKRYSEAGDNPALKEWSGKTLPALQHHLEMAKELER